MTILNNEELKKEESSTTGAILGFLSGILTLVVFYPIIYTTAFISAWQGYQNSNFKKEEIHHIHWDGQLVHSAIFEEYVKFIDKTKEYNETEDETKKSEIKQDLLKIKEKYSQLITKPTLQYTSYKDLGLPPEINIEN